MQSKGCLVTKVEKDGGHEPMRETELGDALAWMENPDAPRPS
jgi:hypothetical protein